MTVTPALVVRRSWWEIFEVLSCSISASQHASSLRLALSQVVPRPP